MAVVLPTAEDVHDDVQDVGNTGLNGNGMNLAQFLDTRGSLAKSRSTVRSDPSDPASPTHPWLAFNADWCSVPASWRLNLLQMIINEASSIDVDFARYIVQEPNFGGVTVPFYYACLRHDFNWRNLHRVKHHLDYTASGGWSGAVRAEADERLKQDLIVLCNANQHGEPEVPDTWDWTLSGATLDQCEEVAGYFKLGVSTVAFPAIQYDH